MVVPPATPAVSQVLTVVFTDVVGSTALKQALGDRGASDLFGAHHALIRESLAEFPDGEEIETAGDSFLLAFQTPSEAVRWTLHVRQRLHAWNQSQPHRVVDRFAVHLGEVIVRTGPKKKDLMSVAVDTCARVLGLADGDRVLLTRPVFDSARQHLKNDAGGVVWLHHGPYALKGLEEPVEICEVGLATDGAHPAPPDSDKAHRIDPNGQRFVPGWRPAVGQAVPGTSYVLEKALGEGAVGETWLVTHTQLREKRVLKFCFQPDRVRSLRRETTLFRLLQERVGAHPNIVGVLDVSFDEVPYYLVMPYAAGGDLLIWWKNKNGNVPREVCLDIVVQVAQALQAAHDAGVVHRDVKPANILVDESKGELHVRLSDFGIGQVLSTEALAGTGREGFTQTMMVSGTSLSGTHLYMAPELLAGQPASPRSDLYSLGVVLFQLLVGDLRRPLPTDWAPLIDDPLLRADLAMCFAGDPDKRFPAALQLAHNLKELPARRAALQADEQRALERERRAYRRGMARVLGGAVLVVAVVVGFAVLAYREKVTAEAASEDAKEQLVLNYLSTGVALRSMDDELAALPWFARVLEQVDQDPERSADARMRLAAVLDHAPRLVGLWSFHMSVGAVALSPDGKRIVASSGEHVAILDPAQLDARVVIDALPADLRALDISPDGGSLGWANTTEVGLVDLDTQAPIFEVGPPTLPWQPKIRFSADGRSLQLRANCVLPVAVLSVVDGSGVEVPSPAPGNTICAWDPAQELGLEVKKVSAWDWTAWTRDRSGHASAPLTVRHVAVIHDISASGLLALAISGDLTGSSAVVVVDSFGVPLSSPMPHPRALVDVRLSEGTKPTLVTLTNDGSVRVWDVASGRLRAPVLQSEGGVSSVAISGKGDLVLTGSNDGLVRLWRIDPNPYYERGLIQIGLAADGRTVEAFELDGLRLYDLATAEPRGDRIRGTFAIGTSADGRFMSTGDRAARVITEIDGGSSFELPNVGPMDGFQWSPKGNRYVTIVAEGIVIADASDPSSRLEYALPGERVSHVAWSPSGSEIAISGPTRVMRLDAATAMPVGPIHAAWRDAAVEYLDDDVIFALSCPGRRTFTCALDREGNVVGTPILVPDAVGIAPHPSGNEVGLIQDNGEIRVYDVQTGQPISKPLRQPGQGAQGTFLADGMHLYTQSNSAPAPRIWNVRTGELVLDIPEDVWGGIQYSEPVQVPFLRADPRPLTAWVEMAELLSGQALTPDGLMTLQPGEVMERWNQLVEAYPEDVGPQARSARVSPSPTR